SAVVAATLVLGVSGVLKAASSAFGGTPTEGRILATAGAIAGVLLVPLLLWVRQARAGATPATGAEAAGRG
ncbi:MAG: hypothetical protein KY444_05010, partial [Gemmatimonadetes bacterium]|nr:hypothetical protein [Gemmatimonadota bacterium]